MKRKMRFGILGCGVIGPHHAKAIAGLREAELVLVADELPGRARKLGEAYGCRWTGEASELLADPGVDAICVCTPSGMHAGAGVAALEAGKHVVIEKPLDVTLEAVDRVLAAQRATGGKVAVISQHRFDPATLVVKEAMEGGRFGRATSGSAEVRWWRSQAYYDSGGWRGTWALDGGGALINQAIHSIDLLQWIMGPVVEVASYTGLLAHQDIEVEDTAVAILRFAGGAIGTIVATTAAYPGLTARIVVHGDTGSAVIDDDRLAYFHAAPDGDGGAGGGGNQAEGEMARFGDGSVRTPGAGADPGSLSMAHRDQIQDFIRAVREDGEPVVNAVEGRKPLAIIRAIYESASIGHPVRVEGAPA